MFIFKSLINLVLFVFLVKAVEEQYQRDQYPWSVILRVVEVLEMQV